MRPPPEVDEDIVSSLYNDINFAVLAGEPKGRHTDCRSVGRLVTPTRCSPGRRPAWIIPVSSYGYRCSCGSSWCQFMSAINVHCTTGMLSFFIVRRGCAELIPSCCASGGR